MSGYAIISLGGKQYRVQEGERLLVDRLKVDEGKTLQPRVLLVGGNGSPDLSPSTTVNCDGLDLNGSQACDWPSLPVATTL